MDPLYLLLLPGAIGVIWIAYQYAVRVPGLWQSSDQFNSTRTWTPAGPQNMPPLPWGHSAFERGLEIITSYLDGEETLEGHAIAYLWPPRPRDWRPTWGPAKHPLMIAVTSRRMMLFEHTPRMVLERYCFIEYGDLQFLHPPRLQLLGTSSRLRFATRAGLEYQMTFLGPIVHPHLLEHEQRLGAYLRAVAARRPSSRVPVAPRTQDRSVGDRVA